MCGVILVKINNAISRFSSPPHHNLLLKVDPFESVDEINPLEAYEQCVQVIHNRLTMIFNISSPGIQCLGSRGILVNFPKKIGLEKALVLTKNTPIVALALVDSSKALDKIKRYISETGLPLDKGKVGGDGNSRKGLYKLIPPNRWLTQDRDGNPFLLESEVISVNSFIINAEAKPDIVPPFYEVSLSMDQEGSQQLENITQKNLGGRVAILVDGVVKTAPLVRTKISTGLISINGLTKEEANNIVILLRAGFLPARISLMDLPEKIKY